MQSRYGVVWCEGVLPRATGQLELRERELRLEGLSGSRGAARAVAYDELRNVRVGRTADERIDGRPTVVLEPRTGPRIRLTTVSPSLVGEIVERLVALAAF